MPLRQQITVLSFLLLPLSLLVPGFAGAASDAEGNTNLLQGDPSFEVGMVGWHAHAGPWRSTDLSNSNYTFRHSTFDNSGPDSGVAHTGKQSVRIGMRPDARAYLTATSPVTLGQGDYTFSAHARCSVPTRIQLRVLGDASGNNEKARRDFYSADAKITAQVNNAWVRVALPFKMATRNAVAPIIDVQGSQGSCWIDTLMLNSGTSPKPYVPPASFVAALNPDGPFATPMPGLLLTQRPAGTTARFTLVVHSDSHPGPYIATIWTAAPEGQRKQITTLEIQAKSGEAKSTPVSFDLPHTGIWKVIAKVRRTNGETSEAETVIATMTPHQGPIDSFFGTQQKLSPLAAPMGLGAVRDMYLLRWSDVMPQPDKWVSPDPEEIDEIRTFVNNGGLYLATLVAENPAKVGYTAAHWGKPDFGGIPHWAQAGKDAAPSELKKSMRAVKPEALAAYAAEAARRYPFLAFEFLNEPLHYLRPDDYTDLLKTAYTAIKKAAPQATVVGMASPPFWHKLPGGSKTKLSGPKPFDWFEQAFEDGAGRHMDAIGIHPYDRTNKNEVPENSYIAGGQAEWGRQLRSLAESLTPGRQLPVWLTEKGVSSPSWRESRNFKSGDTNHRVRSTLTQTRWIVRSQVDMRSHGVEHFFLWNQLWGTSATHRFYPYEDIRYTMFDADGLPRPDLIAQKVLIENLSGVRPVAEGEFRPGTRYALFRADKHLVAVLWAYGKDESAELAGTTQTIPCPSLPGSARQIGLFGDDKPYACTGTLKLTPSPIYIRGTDPTQADAWLLALKSIK
jgi:hypothetical protein